MIKTEIGVVVPTWNSAATLDWTLLSLRTQQDCQVQIIVADSGSTDGTLEICQRWGVESIYVPPGNMYRALNAGMRLIQTNWLTYLNSDDIIYRDSYARLLARGDSTQAEVVYGHTDYIDWDGRFLYSFRSAPPNLLAGLFRQGIMGFAQPATIFRREVFEASKGFNEEFRSIADFDFFFRAIKAGKNFVSLAMPTVTAFRIHHRQLSYREMEVTHQEKKKLFASAGDTAGFADPMAGILWRVSNISSYLMRLLRALSFRDYLIG